MEYLNLCAPPYPYFIVAGTALYRPGDAHAQRSNIGVFDMIFIEYGELYITDENDRYHLVQNDVLILRKDSTHYGHKIVSEKTKFLWLHFNTSGKHYYSKEFHLEKTTYRNSNYYNSDETTITLPLYKKLTPAIAAEFSSAFTKLISASIDKYQQKETRLSEVPSPLECQMLFFGLLNHLQLFQPKNNSSQLLAENIMDYILINYNSDLSLNSIAEYFNFHPVHIIRAIKAKYHITPNKLITQVRLDQAKKLLLTTDYTIEKIALFCGFASASYFSKSFHKQFGLSPNDFRKQNGSV